MNIFVLTTGRTGSMTFYHACKHITNYSVGHESLAPLLGDDRFAYPPNHIEIDNRLAWMLGRLDSKFSTAYYVWLYRDFYRVVKSYNKRWNSSIGIVHAHRIVLKRRDEHISCVEDMVKTINANISLFLRDKKYMLFDIDAAAEDFPAFWETIGAEGDFHKAIKEFEIRYNASEDMPVK